MKKLIFHGSDSWCCKARSIIVRSREGGFVTQNCESCGKPRKLSLTELPSLLCGKCGTRLTAGVSYETNYTYSCTDCERRWAVADLVPCWDELFDYHGFGLDTDQ